MALQQPAIPVRISAATFLRVVVILLGLLLLWTLRDIVIILILSMILAAAIIPWVNWLARRRIPRSLSVLLAYGVILAVVIGVVILLIPAIARESTSISNRFPAYYQKVTDFLSTQSTLKSQTISFAKTNVSFLSRSAFEGLKGFGRSVATFLLVLVITFYFAVDEKNLRHFWIRLVPSGYRDRFVRIATNAVDRIGHWFRGQLLVSATIAAVTYGALRIIGVPDALLLSIIAGVAAFVPFVGAAIGILPALFVALTLSLTKALIVLIVMVALYQLVMNVLMPKMIARSVGLNPIVIVLVMLLGSKLAGATGLILAIPVASVIDTVVRDLHDHPLPR